MVLIGVINKYMNNLFIILVNPQLGQNIGSVARVMKNLNFKNLRIINPRDGWPNVDAITTAAGADDVLENTRIFSSNGEEIGSVTSGTFGPSVNGPVAMGYVKSKFSEIGTSIQLEIRGKKYEGKVSELPFYKKNYVK